MRTFDSSHKVSSFYSRRQPVCMRVYPPTAAYEYDSKTCEYVWSVDSAGSTQQQLYEYRSYSLFAVCDFLSVPPCRARVRRSPRCGGPPPGDSLSSPVAGTIHLGSSCVLLSLFARLPRAVNENPCSDGGGCGRRCFPQRYVWKGVQNVARFL